MLEGMDVVTFFFFSIRLSSLLDITIMHLRYLILFNIIMSAGSINYSVFFFFVQCCGSIMISVGKSIICMRG